MNCLTWNLEWASPKSRPAKLIMELVTATEPDVICFTEALTDLMPPGHLIEADPDYGYPIIEGRRKVLLWSRQPWTEVDAVGDSTMPPGRFISGITEGIRFVGVCIPWKDAHVRTGRRDRQPWEDHLSYCQGLERILKTYAQQSIPICILGDYNQRIPRLTQPLNVFEALTAAIPDHFNVVTAGLTDAEGSNFIDHIAVSPNLEVTIKGILPKVAEDGTKLSDHAGVYTALRKIS